MNREICNVKDPSIKDANELWVYFYLEHKWKLIDRTSFPKPKGTTCQLCPNGARRTNESVVCCQTKVETWSTFKAHLVTVERIYGELVAFPVDTKESELPPLENYVPRYRAYGQLIDYQESEQLCVYDIKQDKFITVHKSMLSKLYTKSGICNYCPCIRKVQSPSSIIAHWQSIENKFYCFLVLENEEQNDKRNQEKIMNFVNSIKDDNSLFDDLCSESERNIYDAEMESDKYCDLDGNKNDNLIVLLNQMEMNLRRDHKTIEKHLHRLKKKVNICSLNQSVINSQDLMTLVKRDEDHEANEKFLTFSKKLELNTENLDYLMQKFDVPSNYRVKNAEFNLNLKFRIKQKQQATLSKSSNSSYSSLSVIMNDGEISESQKLNVDSVINDIIVKQEHCENDSENEEELLNLDRLRGANY